MRALPDAVTLTAPRSIVTTGTWTLHVRTVSDREASMEEPTDQFKHNEPLIR